MACPSGTRAWPGAVGAIWVGPACSCPDQVHPAGGRCPGLLLLIALTGYTVKNAWKNDVFFSWSYFSGWLALPFSLLAGNLDSGKRVKETVQGTNPARRDPSRPPGKPHFNLSKTPQHTPLPTPADRAETPWSSKPQAPGPSRPSTPRPTVLYPSSVLLPLGFCFLLADMILQSTDAISGFPVCL